MVKVKSAAPLPLNQETIPHTDTGFQDMTLLCRKCMSLYSSMGIFSYAIHRKQMNLPSEIRFYYAAPDGLKQ